MKKVIGTATVRLEIDVRVPSGLDESSTYADIKVAITNQAKNAILENLRRASTMVITKEATILEVKNIRVADTEA
jgi:hypothetical protein